MAATRTVLRPPRWQERLHADRDASGCRAFCSPQFFSGAEEERVVAMHLREDLSLLAVTIEQIGDRDDVDLPLGSIAASAFAARRRRASSSRTIIPAAIPSRAPPTRTLRGGWRARCARSACGWSTIWSSPPAIAAAWRRWDFRTAGRDARRRRLGRIGLELGEIGVAGQPLEAGEADPTRRELAHQQARRRAVAVGRAVASTTMILPPGLSAVAQVPQEFA